MAILASLAIVTGMSPAVADGTAVPGTTTTTLDATATATATASTSPSPDPSPSPSPSPTPTVALPSADATVTSSTSISSSTSTSLLPAPKLKTSTTLTSSTSLTSSTTTAVTPPANPSWIWQGGAPTLDDGAKDGTAYDQGSSESDDPATWSKGTADTPKADLLKYYLNVDTSGDVVVSFGFTRASNNGDTAFAVEFNQQGNTSNDPPRPNRTQGDLLLKFHMDPSANMLFLAHAYLWEPTSAFGSYPLGCEPMYGSGFGWCEISRAGFQGRTADDNFTAEGKVDLTTLFNENHTCGGFFNAVNLRGEASAENWTNSLQDYLATPGATVRSTCAQLVIRKLEAGTQTLLTGAEFDVYAGTGTGGKLLYDNVADGSAADSDSVPGQITLSGIEPGTYTVVEVKAPDGYFLPADPQQTLSVGKSATATFSFYDVKQWQPLTIRKDAAGSYDATYAWSIDKRVAQDANSTFFDSVTKYLPDDGDGPTGTPFTYKVEVTQGARTTTHIEAHGNVYVDNPNDRAVDVTLSDALVGGPDCTFADSTVSVPAHAVDQPYAYTCAYPDNTDPATLATQNSATVSWDKSTYPQSAPDALADGSYTATADHAVTWTAHETDKTVTITDDHYTFDPAWTITWTAEGTKESRTYVRTIESGAGNSHTETNTAFVKDGDTVLAQDDATAAVYVGKDLDVSKVSQESLTRTYAWDIHKTSTDTGPLMVDPATGKVTSHFDIKVDAGDSTDKDWLMTGTITVTNPNRWEAVQATNLTDAYSGGAAGDCSIDGWASMSAADRTIPASTPTTVGSKTFHYTCVFATQPAYDGTNTATVTWDKDLAHTPDASDSFDLAIHSTDWTLGSEIDKTVTVWDDNAGTGTPTKLGELTWSPGLSKTYHYTVDLTAPAGACKVWTNTATVKGDLGVELGTSSADVDVCSAKRLEVSKTAHGSFERTYDWGIQKQVSSDGGQTWGPTATWSGNSWSHDFDYRVVLQQLGWDDHDFAITGDITVANPNTDPAIPAISSTLTEAPEVGAPASCVVDDGPGAGTSLVGYTVGPIASGHSVTVPYRCTLTGAAPAYSGADVRNVVTATNATEPSASAPVTFTRDVVHQDSVVIGDSLYAGLPTTSFTFDEAHPQRTYPFDYTLTHTADSADCHNTWTNTATVVSGVTVLDQDSATATVCPVPGTWRVTKSSDADGPVAAGSQITYTLQAIKTGGVDPTNVVVSDDLGPIAPHVSLPASFSPSAGTASVVGGKLVWNIPQLSGTETLRFTVTVNGDAFGVDLPNLVTSPGSQNCPDTAAASKADECTTDSVTPAYTLAKSSDAAATVMPPFNGAAGSVITYTLTVVNTSQAPINPTTVPGASVTDDLGDVMDNATLVPGSITGPGTASISGTTLTWLLPVIPAGGTVHLSYAFRVDAGQWLQTLRNTATPGTAGHCVSPDGCQTTTHTPVKLWLPLSASKDAAGSYDATYAWSIDKRVAATAAGPFVGSVSQHVADDGDGPTGAPFTYRVEVTQGARTTTHIEAHGHVYVDNPNDQPVDVALSDALVGGPDCTFADSTVSVPAHAVDEAYAYACRYPDDTDPATLATHNTATVSWDKATYPQSIADSTAAGSYTASASHAVAWTAHEIDRTVTITDDHFTFDPAWTITWTAAGTKESRTYVRTIESGAGNSHTETNTAFVTSGGTVLAHDDATATVFVGKDLAVSKVSQESLTRTYAWDIHKTSTDTGPLMADPATGKVTSHFDIKVDAGSSTDSAWMMSGAITVTNPNRWEAVQATNLTDAYSGGAAGDCSIDGWASMTAADRTIPASTPTAVGMKAFHYTCSFATKPAYDGTNTATVTWDKASAWTPHASAAFALPIHTDDWMVGPQVDRTVTVWDDNAGTTANPTELDVLTWSPGLTRTYHHTVVLSAPDDACRDWTNTATITGDRGVQLGTSSAQARVCPVPGTWRVTKSSDADGAVAPGSQITYTLSAIKTGGVDPTNVVVNDDLGAIAAHVSLPASFSPSTGTASVVDGKLVWNIPRLSGTETLSFTVTVNGDAFGVDLPNLVTSPGSQNCPDTHAANQADECTTDSVTPAYTLAKASDAGATVMPPYAGNPGSVVTYTLTVVNTSDAPINPTTLPGAHVTDDLGDVMDNATLVPGSITGPGTASISGTTLSWLLPVIPAGGTVHLSYAFRVDAGQWLQTLRNTATPGTAGHCVSAEGCQTTTGTPSATQMAVRKVNAETGAPLAGAEFTLYGDNAPFASGNSPVIGPEDTTLGTATTGADGLATFAAQLQRGHFLVKETGAPPSYDLPATGDTMAVVVDDSNFVADGVMAPFEFRDPAEGQLAIVAKQQFEKDPLTGAWVPSDGVVNYGDLVKYVVSARATGPKLFHDVQLSDYVPGYNPVDTVSTAKASLVPGTAKCTGDLVCDVSVGDDGLVTWYAGTVTDAAGTVEMVVKFPELPPEDRITYDANGRFETDIWNVAQLSWDEVTFQPTQQLPTGRFAAAAAAEAGLPMTHHVLTSNEVIERAVVTAPLPPVVVPPKGHHPHAGPPPGVRPPVQGPPPSVLPNTGGPSAWVPLTGTGLLILGMWMLVGRRARRRRA